MARNWVVSYLPPFFSLYRDQSCVRGRKGIECRGDLHVTDRGNPSRVTGILSFRHFSVAAHPPIRSILALFLRRRKEGIYGIFYPKKKRWKKKFSNVSFSRKKGVARRWRIRFSKKGSEWERGVGRSKNRRNIKRLVKARKVWYSETKRGKAAFTRGNRAKVFSGRPCPVRALSRINRGKRAVTTTDVSPFFSSAR